MQRLKKRTALDWTAIRRSLAEREGAIHAASHPDTQSMQRVLEKRATQLSKRKETSGSQNEIELLLFRLDGADRFAIETKHVLAVGNLKRCTPIPGAPALLHGIFTHREELRSVINLGVLLDRSETDDGEPGSFVLLRIGATRLCVRVSRLEQAVLLPEPELITALPEEFGLPSALVKGLSRDGIIVIRAEGLLSALASLKHATESFADLNTDIVSDQPQSAGGQS